VKLWLTSSLLLINTVVPNHLILGGVVGDLGQSQVHQVLQEGLQQFSIPLVAVRKLLGIPWTALVSPLRPAPPQVTCCAFCTVKVSGGHGRAIAMQ
jgi:hypothetical protein